MKFSFTFSLVSFLPSARNLGQLYWKGRSWGGGGVDICMIFVQFSPSFCCLLHESSIIRTRDPVDKIYKMPTEYTWLFKASCATNLANFPWTFSDWLASLSKRIWKTPRRRWGFPGKMRLPSTCIRQDLEARTKNTPAEKVLPCCWGQSISIKAFLKTFNRILSSLM